MIVVAIVVVIVVVIVIVVEMGVVLDFDNKLEMKDNYYMLELAFVLVVFLVVVSKLEYVIAYIVVVVVA